MSSPKRQKLEPGRSDDPERPQTHEQTDPQTSYPAQESTQFDEKFFLYLSKKTGEKWKDLAIYLGFKQEDLEAFEANNPNNLQETSREMLVAWSRMQTEDLQARQRLKTALAKTGRNDLALKIQVDVHPQSQLRESTHHEGKGPARVDQQLVSAQDVAANTCEAEIKLRYTTTGSFVQLLPWVDDDTKHTMYIYTQLQLENDDDTVGNLGKKVILKSYEDIFSMKTPDGCLITRGILIGLAGLGKSTLFDKMAHDWAIKSCYKLRGFKLLFLLKMHALNQTSDLIDAVFDQLLDDDTSVNKTALESFINNNSKKVLILLDGFDEFMTTSLDKTQFGSILKILNRKAGRQLSVLVTTRPSHFEQLVKSLVQKPFTYVRVLGFSDEDITGYVDKFYSEKKDEAKSLIGRIQSSDVLFDLAKSPMLLLLMCLLWRGNSSLPETMSRLYHEAIGYIFRRKTDMSSDEMLRMLKEVGKIALRGLTSSKLLLAFPERDFKKNVLDLAIKVGFLTSQRVLRGLETHNSVQFIHKTFQEFCAALYCQSLLETDIGEFQRILDQIDKPYNFEYLLRFCCGDNRSCSQIVLRMLQNKPTSVGDNRCQLTLNCYYESQSETLLATDFIESVLAEKVTLRSYNSDSLSSFMWLLKHVKDNGGERGAAVLAKVKDLMIDVCAMENLGADFTNSANSMPNLSCLEMKSCSLTAQNMQHVASSLSILANFTELKLSGNTDLGGTAAQWVSQLKQLRHLRKLDLSGCSLVGEDVIHVVCSLSNTGTFVELDLSRNKTLAPSSLTWSPHLREIKHLHTLVLRSCDLTGDNLNAILLSLGGMTSIAKLDISANPYVGGSLARWADHLAEIPRLEKVDFSECSLTTEDLKRIAQSQIKESNLTDIVLNGNKGLAGNAHSWAPSLKEMNQIQRLKLRYCSLTVQDVEAVAFTLGDIRAFVALDLSGNGALGGSGSQWAPSFQKLQNLQILNVSRCSLQTEDVGHVAVSLAYIPTLIDLDLSWNKALGGMGVSWAPHLKNIKSLRKISFRECSLEVEDVRHISEELSKTPDLFQLDLSWNSALAGEGASWAPHLQKLHSLKTLKIIQYSLTDEDRAHIDASRKSMPNLVDYSS